MRRTAPMLAGLLLLGLPGSRSAAQPAPAKPGPDQVGEATAHRGELQAEVKLAGWLSSRGRLRLSAPQLPDQTWLTVVELAREGSLVKAGQTLVRFDPAGPQAGLARAEHQAGLARLRLARLEAELAADRLELQLAAGRVGLELERARLLAVRGVGLIPELQVQQARLDRRSAELRAEQARQALTAFERTCAAELEVARQALSSAESRVERARWALGQLELRAPAAGLVRILSVRSPGGQEQAAQGVVVRVGEGVVELLDPDDLLARFPIQIDPAAAFRPDDRVSLGFPGLGQQRIEGRVLGVFSACQAGPQIAGRECPLEVQVTPGKGHTRLRPEMGVELTIRLSVASQVLRVPRRAVVNRQARDLVWCLEPGASGWREVRLGRQTPEWAEVLSGLEEGVRISLEPERSQAPGPGQEPIAPQPIGGVP